jgi:aerobic carbon-monoxide dehydrogenase medium subunit
MKPAPFEYVDARTLDAAVALLARHGDEARLLAGGQSLVPLMNMRLARPRVVIDLNRVASLAYIRETDGGLAIGAMTRQAAVEHSRPAADRWPLLVEALALAGHPAIRNRGTLGGSLAHADPAAELPAAVLALDGRVTLAGPHGERTVEARAFFRGALTTAMAPDEILTEVALPPLPSRTGACFLEVARRHGDFALVAVAAVATLDATGACTRARLAFAGVGSTPLRVERAEALLAGRGADAALFAEAARVVSGGLEPDSDLHASADYRREVAGTLTRRALARAWERAGRAA